jgi:hypothetical protein
MTTRTAIGALLLISLALSLGGQEQRPGPPKPEAQVNAMARLQQMAGTWTGEGWMDFGERRSTFRGSEVVQSKLGGTALLVEGNFFAKIGDADVPVHTTLGVISYDPQTQKYRFTSWLATGTSGERELVVTDNGWTWETKTPRGVMRYTTRFADGQWLETGERSADGTAWKQFFEMTLRKK